MVNVSIDVTDLGGEARPGDKVVLWKPAAAGSATHAGRVISTAPVDVFLNDGKATVSNVEPGDMRVLLQCRGVESQGPIPVTVPDGTGTVTLRSLIEKQFEYSPPVVSAVQQAADNAAASERAAIQAQVRSEAAADRAETRVDEAINNGAELVRNEVKQDADRAVGAKNDAQAAQSEAESSAASAQESATAAAESADATEADRQEVTTAHDETLAARDTAVGAAETATAQAGTATDRAGAAAESAAAAGESETRAAASAQTATQQADRATSEADRSKTEADRAASEAEASSVKAVAEKVNELLAGAPEAYDTLLEIAEELERSQSAEAALVKEIAGKAPLDHTHTAEDVGAAPADHTHTVADVSGLQSALDGKANTATVNQRPALFSGAGAPPASIPGAVVGDWWLDTDSKNLYTITGV